MVSPSPFTGTQSTQSTQSTPRARGAPSALPRRTARGPFAEEGRKQQAARLIGRQNRNNGYATKSIVDGTDRDALVTDWFIIVFFYSKSCIYCEHHYKEVWNEVANENNTKGRGVEVPMIAVEKEAMITIVRGTDRKPCPGLIGGYVKEFPTVRLMRKGECVLELDRPVRGRDGKRIDERLREFVQTAIEMSREKAREVGERSR